MDTRRELLVTQQGVSPSRLGGPLSSLQIQHSSNSVGGFCLVQFRCHCARRSAMRSLMEYGFKSARPRRTSLGGIWIPQVSELLLGHFNEHVHVARDTKTSRASIPDHAPSTPTAAVAPVALLWRQVAQDGTPITIVCHLLVCCGHTAQ